MAKPFARVAVFCKKPPYRDSDGFHVLEGIFNSTALFAHPGSTAPLQKELFFVAWVENGGAVGPHTLTGRFEDLAGNRLPGEGAWPGNVTDPRTTVYFWARVVLVAPPVGAVYRLCLEYDGEPLCFIPFEVIVSSHPASPHSH